MKANALMKANAMDFMRWKHNTRGFVQTVLEMKQKDKRLNRILGLAPLEGHTGCFSEQQSRLREIERFEWPEGLCFTSVNKFCQYVLSSGEFNEPPGACIKLMKHYFTIIREVARPKHNSSAVKSVISLEKQKTKLVNMLDTVVAEERKIWKLAKALRKRFKSQLGDKLEEMKEQQARLEKTAALFELDQEFEKEEQAVAESEVEIERLNLSIKAIDTTETLAINLLNDFVIKNGTKVINKVEKIIAVVLSEIKLEEMKEQADAAEEQAHAAERGRVLELAKELCFHVAPTEVETIVYEESLTELKRVVQSHYSEEAMIFPAALQSHYSEVVTTVDRLSGEGDVDATAIWSLNQIVRVLVNVNLGFTDGFNADEGFMRWADPEHGIEFALTQTQALLPEKYKIDWEPMITAAVAKTKGIPREWPDHIGFTSIDKLCENILGSGTRREYPSGVCINCIQHYCNTSKKIQMSNEACALNDAKELVRVAERIDVDSVERNQKLTEDNVVLEEWFERLRKQKTELSKHVTLLGKVTTFVNEELTKVQGQALMLRKLFKRELDQVPVEELRKLRKLFALSPPSWALNAAWRKWSAQEEERAKFKLDLDKRKKLLQPFLDAGATGNANEAGATGNANEDAIRKRLNANKDDIRKRLNVIAVEETLMGIHDDIKAFVKKGKFFLAPRELKDAMAEANRMEALHLSINAINVTIQVAELVLTGHEHSVLKNVNEEIAVVNDKVHKIAEKQDSSMQNKIEAFWTAIDEAKAKAVTEN